MFFIQTINHRDSRKLQIEPDRDHADVVEIDLEMFRGFFVT